MGDENRKADGGPVLRRDASSYGLHSKVLYGAAWLLAYCVFMVGLRYFAYDDPVDVTLSSAGFYLSALVTLAMIVVIYWFMSDRSEGSRRNG